jgi:hypothetical protein
VQVISSVHCHLLSVDDRLFRPIIEMRAIEDVGGQRTLRVQQIEHDARTCRSCVVRRPGK